MSEKKANRQIDQHIIENASRKPAWRYSVLLIGFVAFFAFGILLYLTVEEVLPPSKNQIATPENREALLEKSPEEDPMENNYEVVMSTNWNFPDGAAISQNAYVENSSINTNTVYFTITRKDTDEILYISPRIPPGSYLTNIRLSQTLEQGDYETILTYYLLDEEKHVVSTIPMKLMITVEQ